MPTSWGRDLVPLAAIRVAALAAATGLAGCDGDTADLIRELEAARGDCTMDAMRAASEECVQMFERYAEMSSEAINTYIGGVRALDEALRRTGGLSLDTAGLPGALSGDFLPGGPGSASQVGGGWPDPYAAGPSWPYDDRYTGVYGGDPGPGPYDDLPAPYRDPRDPYTNVPDAGGAGAYPSTQRGVLLPPDVRLRRPWIEPDAYVGSPEDVRESPGYRPGSSYGSGAPPGGVGTWGYQGGIPGHGPVPRYGYPPGYGNGYPPGYGGYGYQPYWTVPGAPGYQGYPAPPGYYPNPGYGGHPGDGRYPGDGRLPDASDPRFGDPRYDSRNGPGSRLNDRTIQRTPRAYDP